MESKQLILSTRTLLTRNTDTFFQLEGKEPATDCQAQHCFKTKICPFLLTGKCFKGKECSFAHSEEELRTIPDLKKTKLCTKYQMGFCPKGSFCSFAHGEQELIPPPNFYKTSLCIPFANGMVCKFGKKCKFAHGYHELREKPQPSAGAKICVADPSIKALSYLNSKEAPIEMDKESALPKTMKSLVQFESLQEKLLKQSRGCFLQASNSSVQTMGSRSSIPYSTYKFTEECKDKFTEGLDFNYSKPSQIYYSGDEIRYNGREANHCISSVELPRGKGFY